MPKKARLLSVLRMKRPLPPCLHAVSDVAGLLRADKSDARSWVLRYSTGETRLAKSGKSSKARRDHGSGGYPDILLVKACEPARKLREMLAEGIESVLTWTTVHEYRTAPNPAAGKGSLDAPAKIKKKVHHRHNAHRRHSRAMESVA